MDDLLLTDQTRHQLAALLTVPPHGLLLTGAVGIGKLTIARTLAAQLTEPAHIAIVQPDEKGTISIETVRTLYQGTRGKQQARQIVIIDHAEAMGVEAQNALLKLLEEPRSGVTFILTAPTDSTLLPTITSRVQSVTVSKVSQKALQQLAASINDSLQPQELAQLLFVADGRPATLVRLLIDTEAFARHKQLMQQAKQLLTATPYERLSQVANLAKNKEDAISLLEAMARMLQVQLLRDPNDQFIRLADGIQLCLARLTQNGNPRAQLTALFASH